MISSLRKNGYEIGVHSYSHRRLGDLEGEELCREIAFAREKFREKGIVTSYFAYPYGFYGDFSKNTEKVIKESGYEASFTNIMGDNVPGDDIFRLKRTRVSWRDNPLRFRMKIGGAYDWVDSMKRRLIR